MLYALICTDKPGSGELRQTMRPEHVAYLNSLGASLKAAGPFTYQEGKPTGSLVIVEAENRKAPGRSPTAILMPKRGCFARSKSAAGSGRSRTRRARNGLLVVQVASLRAWSWEQQKAKGKAGEEWTGVRNFQARKNMKAMKLAIGVSSITRAKARRSWALSK